MRTASRSRVAWSAGKAMAATTAEIAQATTRSTSAKPRVRAFIDSPQSLNGPGRGASLPRRLLRLRGNDDQRLELEEAFLADALDVHEVLDLLEAAVLLAIVENALRCRPPDAREFFELVERRGV